MESSNLTPYLEPGAVVASACTEVLAFVGRVVDPAAEPRARAVGLYYAVRDEIRYDPYTVVLTPEGLGPRRTLELGRGWCVPKAILLAACCRAVGIPARLGFADVRNHLSTEKMRRLIQTDVFYWHGYTSIFLDGRWLKATPAFNVELCSRFGLHPLEFDGTEDSIYHEFDREENRYMEYIADRGEHAEPPIAEIEATFRRRYPRDLDLAVGAASGNGFDREVEAETADRRVRETRVPIED